MCAQLHNGNISCSALLCTAMLRCWLEAMWMLFLSYEMNGFGWRWKAGFWLRFLQSTWGFTSNEKAILASWQCICTSYMKQRYLKQSTSYGSESQYHQGWKRPLKSPRPTSHLSPILPTIPQPEIKDMFKSTLIKFQVYTKHHSSFWLTCCSLVVSTEQPPQNRKVNSKQSQWLSILAKCTANASNLALINNSYN